MLNKKKSKNEVSFIIYTNEEIRKMNIDELERESANYYKITLLSNQLNQLMVDELKRKGGFQPRKRNK